MINSIAASQRVVTDENSKDPEMQMYPSAVICSHCRNSYQTLYLNWAYGFENQ